MGIRSQVQGTDEFPLDLPRITSIYFSYIYLFIFAEAFSYMFLASFRTNKHKSEKK